MADSVAIMYRGKLQQHAAPAKLYAQPANTFVARFVGSPPMNILSGSITDGVFRCPEAEIPLGPTAPAGDIELGFRPESAAVVAASEQGAMPVRVYTVEPLGNEVIVSFLIGDTIVHVRAPADSPIAMGDSCGLQFDRRYLHLFNPADGQRMDWAA